jgi:hypothetical protein
MALWANPNLLMMVCMWAHLDSMTGRMTERWRVRSSRVLPVEAQDLGHCPVLMRLLTMKVGLGMKEAGMRAKEGLVCRGRVSLVI